MPPCISGEFIIIIIITVTSRECLLHNWHM